MRLAHSFVVDREVEEVFERLLDLTTVAACLPGARLTRSVDDRHAEGELAVKIGPLAAHYEGTATVTTAQPQPDHSRRAIRLRARGTERDGAGAADALVEATLAPTGHGTEVMVRTDLSIRGTAAKYGHGTLAALSAKQLDRFAENLRASFDARATDESADESIDAPVPASDAAGPATASSDRSNAAATEPAPGRARWMASTAAVLAVLGGVAVALRRLRQRH